MEAVVGHSCVYGGQVRKPCLPSSSSSSSFTGQSLLPPPLPNMAKGRSASRPLGGGVVVVAMAKGKRRFMPGMPQPQKMPRMPKFDENDDTPKFVIFIRDKKIPIWFPLSMVTGGSVAKMMVTAKDNPLGKSLAESALTRNIGAAIYKDEKSIRMSANKAYSVLKTATELEYGYKLVDKSNPQSSFSISNVIKIPPKEEIRTVVDKVKGFFDNSLGGIKDSLGLNLSGQQEGSSEGGKNS